MRALIVAAGLGTRLRGIAPSKPLALINGRPLIQGIIETAALSSIRDFVVVTGYQATPLEAFLRRLSARTGLTITTAHNPDWTQANGLSVLAAEPLLDNEFVLLMSDHLFEPALLVDLLSAPRVDRGVTLAVDRRLDNPLVDLDDVTRVKTGAAGVIRAIGKGIEDYDAFDTGLFLASTGLIDGIRSDLAKGGRGSISDGMTWLARRELAYAFDVGDRFWLDVDDAAAWERAEKLTA